MFYLMCSIALTASRSRQKLFAVEVHVREIVRWLGRRALKHGAAVCIPLVSTIGMIG